jgi:hypothetical protein
MQVVVLGVRVVGMLVVQGASVLGIEVTILPWPWRSSIKSLGKQWAVSRDNAERWRVQPSRCSPMYSATRYSRKDHVQAQTTGYQLTGRRITLHLRLYGKTGRQDTRDQ